MKQNNSESRVLGEEIFRALHRWPLIVAFILVGGLIGFLVSYIWPSPYEASLPLYVNLNPYRTFDDQSVEAFAQVDFRNIDDYKHWQMSQMNVLMLSDDYLQETLNLLKEDDNYWNSIGVGEFRKTLQVAWRNAGEWRISSKVKDPERAKKVVEIWRQIILDKVNSALENSRTLFSLELEQRAIEDEIIDTKALHAKLRDIQKTLNQMSQQFEEGLPDKPLGALDRLTLIALIASTSELDSGWRFLLEEIPLEDAELEEYIAWIDRVLFMIDIELKLLDEQLVELSAHLEQVNESWSEALAASQGLSVSLAVEDQNRTEIEVKQSRDTGLAVVVGSIIGFLGWGFLVLFQISRKGNS